MAVRLHELGYDDYRRSDAASLRLLLCGPLPIGELGSLLGITRQAAGKLAGGLVRRSYAHAERDAHDSRRTNIVLTPAGRAYARSVAEVLVALNRELAALVDPVQLTAADAVLRVAVAGDRSLAEAAACVRPPA